MLFSDHPTAAQVDQRLCSSFDTSAFFPTCRSYTYFPTSTELWAFDRRPPLYRSTTWYLFSDHTDWYLFLNWRTSLTWSINDSWPEFPPPPPPILTHALTWFPPLPPLSRTNPQPFLTQFPDPCPRPCLSHHSHLIFFSFHCKTAQTFRTETWPPPNSWLNLWAAYALIDLFLNLIRHALILQSRNLLINLPCNTTEKEVNVLYLN